jgi:hypothetical protein
MRYKKEYSKTQEKGCDMIKKNQLEIMNSKLSQVVLRRKCYEKDVQ